MKKSSDNVMLVCARVKQIAAELKQEQSMISHNLRQLVNYPFGDVRREGKQRIYTLNYTTINPLIKMIKNHCHESCMDGENCYLRQESGD